MMPSRHHEVEPSYLYVLLWHHGACCGWPWVNIAARGCILGTVINCAMQSPECALGGTVPAAVVAAATTVG